MWQHFVEIPPEILSRTELDLVSGQWACIRMRPPQKKVHMCNRCAVHSKDPGVVRNCCGGKMLLKFHQGSESSGAALPLALFDENRHQLLKGEVWVGAMKLFVWKLALF